MRNKVRLTFTLEESTILTNVLSAYAAHLKMTACRNGTPTQFDESIQKYNELGSRFYYALIDAEYGTKLGA